MKYKILVVDDESVNTRMLERVFRGEFDVVAAESGREALELLTVHDIALIVSDQRMPEMTGVEFLKRAAEMRPHSVRIILTGYTDANDLVEALNSNVVYKYITKPWINTDLLQTVKRGLSHHETIKAQHRLNLENQRLRDRLNAAEAGFVQVFSEMLRMRSETTVEHAARTREIAEEIGHALELDHVLMKQLSLAAFMHDVADLNVPPSLLRMFAELTEEERAELNDSRETGLALLAGAPNVEEIEPVLRHQSEFFDGTGGPLGLSADQIPLTSRILAVACAYAEMAGTASAPGRFTEAEATETLRAGSGLRFDPNIVNIFCGLKSLSHIRQVLPETSLPIAN